METKSSVVSRIRASLVLLVVGVSVVATVFFSFINSDFQTNVISGTLRGYSNALAFQVQAHPETENLQRIARDNNVTLVLVGPDNTTLAFDHTGSPVSEDILLNDLHGWMRFDIFGPEGERVTFLWDLSQFTEGHLPFLAGLLIIFAFVIGAAYWFQRAQLKPLRWLRSGVNAVGKGDFKVRVPVVRNDEIGQVASAFNQMTGTVEQMMTDQERLMADVSHELRSPLARIKVGLEFMPEGPKRDSIKRDVGEMESLIAVLLEREQLHAKAKRLEKTSVSITELAKDVVTTFDDATPKVVFACQSKDIRVAADRTLLRVVIQNLIDNAVKFSEPDSDPIVVDVEETNRTVTLSVSDNGRGIPDEDIDHIFQPFVKLDRSRGHRVGFGLGLNLCWRIVTAHHGTIRLQPSKPCGTRAIVQLPT